MSAAQDTNSPVADSLDAWKARARELESMVKHWELRYAKLEYKHNDLLRRIFGPKNEALSPDQRALFGISEAPPQCPPPSNTTAQANSASTAKPKRKGGGRRPKPEHLPVHREVIDLPEAMRAGLKIIREEITEQIEYRPSLFYKHQIVRLVYGDPERLRPPTLAPLPAQVIPQAGVGPGFITHVLIAKYLDHLPLYRQERIDARGGVWIGRQARCRYVEGAAHLLITIREQLKQKILSSRYVQVDETFTKLLDPDRRGRSHDAYLWGYHAPHEKALVLEFSTSRSGSILYDFFPPNWSGVVQTDGAKMYPGVFRHRRGVIHIECVGHLRRYLVEALRANEREAVQLLQDITALYRIEQEADALGLSHERRGYWRHAKAKPVLKRLQRRFRALEASVPLFGKLREAVTYAQKRWPHLVRYAKVGFGHVHIDQNPIERCFRPSKVGLRNYLFIGHPRAGWRSAVIYSVIGTCRLVGVNPEAYIRWVLPKLAAASNRNATGLLPHDFARQWPMPSSLRTGNPHLH